MIATALLVIVILVLVSILSIGQRRSKNYPPGPFSVAGSQSFVKQLSRDLGGQHRAFQEISRRYSSDVIALRLGFTNTLIVVCGRRCVQEVLHNENFDGRPWNEFIKIRNMGKRKGITMNDGPEWKELRSWMVRTFRTIGLGTNGMSDLIKNELVDVLDNLKGDGPVKMKDLLSSTVINVLWSFVTGKRFCEGARLNYFTDLMDRRTRLFDMTGGLLSTFPWVRYIAPDATGYNLLCALNNELRSFLMETIEEHKRNYVPGTEKDLIDLFLAEMYNEKRQDQIFTDDQLVMLLVDMFLAGCSTTTKTLDFLFLNMVVHQDVQARVQAEIDAVIGTDRLPDVEDRSRLPYLEAVLTESQRMWLVTPIIGPRRVLKDTKLDGYLLPKGSSVLLNVYSVHMDPEVHKDPQTFNPDRFIRNGLYQPDENVINFGKGKRRCPGEVLARSALFLIFAGIMKKYKLLPVPGNAPDKVDCTPGLVITAKPYEVLVVPRSTS